MRQAIVVGSAFAVGIAVGFYAGEAYLQHRIAIAFSGIGKAFAPDAVSSLREAPMASFTHAQATADEALKGLTIIGAHVIAKQVFGPTLMVSVKNDTLRTFSSIDFACTVKSPGREVAWADCPDVYGKIPGGLAPSEMREIEGFSLGSLASVAGAMQAHPDAELSVRIIKADGPQP